MQRMLQDFYMTRLWIQQKWYNQIIIKNQRKSMFKFNDVDVKCGKFPDGTLLMGFNPILTDESENTIIWKYEDDAEIFDLICIKKQIDKKNYMNLPIYLMMPYIPHARMDRCKYPEDVFTLKYFAEILNSLKFTNVFVMNAHSNVSLALIDNIVDTSKNDVNIDVNAVCGKVPSISAIFYPDEGACKRYSEMEFNNIYKSSFGIKKRDWATGKIMGLEVMNAENIIGKDVLIVDDICSKGGTFYYAAKKLKELGAKDVYLYVSHCENTIKDGELLKDNSLIKKIYTTDSILKISDPKIEVIRNY